MALALALLICLLRLGILRLRGPLTPVRRALWLQSASRIVLASLGIHYRVTGKPPQHGLVASNHLSYLDIAIYSAVMPCAFISKIEIGKWPYFGFAARAGGTIFIDRSSRASAAVVVQEMATRLQEPVPILFFPEGTSTDGSRVLRFHSSLFESAAVHRFPVTAAAVRYIIQDGTPERELCWFGDTGFLPHMWKALGTSGFRAEVTFSTPHIYEHRRSAASATQFEVCAMRAGEAFLAAGEGQLSL